MKQMKRNRTVIFNMQSRIITKVSKVYDKKLFKTKIFAVELDITPWNFQKKNFSNP
jgi:hypothetical protein